MDFPCRQFRGRARWFRCVSLVLLLLAGATAVHGALTYQPQVGDLRLTSPAFKDRQRIPSQYTCDSRNISPPLNWTGAPAETKSLALIVDDPDASGAVFVHWIVFNMGPTATGLAEDVPKGDAAPGHARQGKNDVGQIGYGGPCPSPGKAHRYVFKLYALDTRLDLKAGATKKELEAAMSGHVIARTQFIGVYQRN
jgi:Raf kinase inhibitor-like YbhB/YbcL family protein